MLNRQPFRRSLTLNQTHPNLPLSILHLDETDVNINKNEEEYGVNEPLVDCLDEFNTS